MKCRMIITGVALFVLLFPAAAAIAPYSEEETLQKTARDLYERIMCPICPGQTIAQSSSGSSLQMRDLILKKLRQGESKEEILQFFASRYGERILAKPNKKGLNLMLWFLPFILVAVAAIIIYVLIRHWSERVHTETALRFEEAQISEYKERLEKELKDFDKSR